MPKTDPFCKWISKHLSNGKASKHEMELSTDIKRLPYKHIMDSGQKFLALVIPKSWKYTVLGEAHDKLGHQGNTHTYCLIKRQYYWKGMNKDICKYITNCALCCREKAKIQNYLLQMMEIPNRPFDKNCNRPGYRIRNINIQKQTYPYHYQPLNRMARGILYTGQICRYYSLNLHQYIPTCTCA